MADALPDRALVVVVGGGIVGCSVAYHLTQLGWTDVVLLERKRLTSGTTWHAAGLVTLARPTAGTRDLVKRSIRIFEGLEAATGQATGYRRTGTIHLATRSDRWEELQRQASAGRASELEIEVIDTERAQELFPLLNTDGIVGGLYYPRDGRGNATDTTMALARGARAGGARIYEQTSVTEVTTRGRRVTGVTTDAGHIEAEVVVNCTGMWGRSSGRVMVSLSRCRRWPTTTSSLRRSRAWASTSRPSRLRRLRLRQGRGRRPDGRLLRAGELRVVVTGHPC